MEPIPNFEEIDIQKHLQVLQRHWVSTVGVFGVVVTLSTVYAFSLKPTYTAEGSVLISKNHTSSLTGLGEAIGRLESLGVANASETQVKIITSNPLLQETISALDLKDDKGKRLKIDALKGKLKVGESKGSDVLQITYTDKSPDLAAAIVNKVMSIYITNNILVNRAEAVSARKFIQQQLPATEEAVIKAESALRKFKEGNKVIALQQEATLAVTEISRLETQISQAQAQLVNVTARSQKLKNQATIDSPQAVTFASLSQIPGIQQVLAQRQEAQSQLVVARTLFQPKHPSVIDLEEKVAALDGLIQQRIRQGVGRNQQVRMGNLQIGQLRQQLIADFTRSEVERAGLVRQITTLSHQWSAYKQRASVLPRLEQTQRELERRLTAAQTTYQALLARLQEVQVTENQTIGNARVISPALIPDKPSGPRKVPIVGLAGVAGILLSVISAFGLDLIDRSLKTVKEAREVLQYTLLGVIPTYSWKGRNGTSVVGVDQSIPRVIGRDIPQFPIGDAYQMLQANLKFLSSDQQLKAIAVTSSVSKEGKSEVSANLAVAMAQVGRRVLLVDADMRRPTQHHIWGMTNAVGLSNVIVDQVALDLAIREPIPNLYVLPSGVVPPNPVALLDSQRMAALVNIFIRDYDFVIFDTPPLAGLADAAVLGNLVDGILLVVRPGVVSSASAHAVKEFLNQSGQKVLGMVVNGVNVKSEPDSYFYYHSREQIEPSFVSHNSVNLSGGTRRRERS